MLEYMRDNLVAAENAAASGDQLLAMQALRRLSLDDFGMLTLEMPNAAWPALSKLLPAMATEETQRNWTGASGLILLRQSLNFVRIVSHRFREQTGESLSGKRVLDYGCGYGRLLRLFNYFAENDALAGCDPWDRSIDLCRESGLRCRLDVTDYLPETLPYEAGYFDLAYAFSVFTHTSLRATKTALAALRSTIRQEGMLAITIRPIEYWDHHTGLSNAERQQLKDSHRKAGFAFRPHNRAAVDGDVTYGDTSMTFEFLSEVAKDWRLSAYDHTFDDYHQIIAFLTPA